MTSVLVCPKCGSENVNVQVVGITKTKKKGCLYWFFIGWWLETFMLLFLTLQMLIFKLFGRSRKVHAEVETFAVCQSCGNRWET